MSEPKLISPLLDTFAMGGAISSHDGVSCYPAMKEASEQRYIVKIISIPASQVQLDALLLSGAYPSAEAAKVYFKELVNDVVNETEVLRRLSKLEGFMPFESYQVVPMEDGVGYQVYLLSQYRRTVARQFERVPTTHLGALNLGIDLCSAMSLCRQAGCLYVDLKPSNVFVTEDGRYCVGDLGLIPLSSLQYASLPDKYRSSWTAPEIVDAYSSLNESMDIYAIGLILYQAYNNGSLPFEGSAPAEVLPPPMYADYEMAEIILKACAPDPADRWQTPGEMGQALIAYMQRNGANNTPIVPPVVDLSDPGELPQQKDQPEDDEPDFPLESADAAGEAADPAAEETPDESGEASDCAPEEQLPEELAFISDLVSDETAPAEADTADLENASLTAELTSMLAQADELLAHELPAPAVAPDPIDVPIPEPIRLDDEKEEEAPTEEEAQTSDEPAPEVQPENPSEEDEINSVLLNTNLTELHESDDSDSAEEADEQPAGFRRSYKKLYITLSCLVAAAALILGLYYGYQQYYLQPVDKLVLSGYNDSLTVRVESPVDSALLKVICTDMYGHMHESGLTDGTAVFDQLTPNSQYTVRVEMEGFHRLTGEITDTYTTPPKTDVVSFIATAGPEDGSVILNFTVDGTESEIWNVIYSAEGETEQTAAFTSHTATISGLTVGKEYTFRIEPEDPLFLTGTTELKFTASELILAENLRIESCDEHSLTVAWDTPADVAVKEWTVRCYSENGYDQVLTTKDNSIVFTDVDTSVSNTVEVTANAMTKCSRVIVTENPVTVSNIRLSDSAPSQMTLEWDYSGKAPADGWFVSWSVDGSEVESGIPCTTNSAVIFPVIPDTLYHFTIQSSSGSAVFGGAFNTVTTAAGTFEGYGASAENMQFSMCRTPDMEEWGPYDVSEEDFTTEFAAGERASFLIYLAEEYEVDYDDVTTLFVIQDESGKVIDLQTSVRRWVDMWYEGYCELDIPSLPAQAGSYSMVIYFNGQFVTTQDFTVK